MVYYCCKQTSFSVTRFFDNRVIAIDNRINPTNLLSICIQESFTIIIKGWPLALVSLPETLRGEAPPHHKQLSLFKQRCRVSILYHLHLFSLLN